LNQQCCSVVVHRSWESEAARAIDQQLRRNVCPAAGVLQTFYAEFFAPRIRRL
jgi:hypothetical protein